MTLKEITSNRPVMKMQGCGNDFVVLFDIKDKLNKDIVNKICSLHYGVGSDGLIAVMNSRVKEASYRMKFYNPDGSLAEMCGNGIRCFTKYLADLKLISEKDELVVDTDAGLIRCQIVNNKSKNALIMVNMGKPVFLNPSQVALSPGEDGIVRGKTENFYFTFVSMGNPHVVIFTDNPKDDVKKYGSIIEKSTNIFPQKTNVEFVKVNSKNDITMFVWERGAGETLACGTGACATLVASVINSKSDNKAVVHLLGGDLTIEWQGINNPVYMTGNAENVFEINTDSLDKYLLSE
ncbi:MAG: diaminopimelate epimerase [Spirochaetes bacterium]|nr:diaminopimelate epimerase [Spirochaetota bacterium]